MTSVQRSLKSIFDEAAEIASPQERAKFVERVCGSDAALRLRVNALLRALDEAGDFLEASPVVNECNMTTVNAKPAPFGVDHGQTTEWVTSGNQAKDKGESTEVYEGTPSKPHSRPSEFVLPGYVIHGVIARGGMGVVFKAHHLRLDRDVAVKQMLAGAHASPEELERFASEARAVAKLQHEGIVQIFDVGEHQGLPYFALEFVPGGSLSKKIAGKPQPVNDAAVMLRELALAMHEAHSQNIVHRDLKPANILLSLSGHPKITDFGLAKRMDSDSDLTRTNAIMGTPSYMAPEQAWGKTHEIGPLSDIYSLGAILYEMLVGHPPHQGATALETIELARSQEPVAPRRLQPKIPIDLETICLKCLQKEPVKRYASAGELADDLTRFLEDRPIKARPVGAPERLVRWCKRNPKIAALTGTVAALLVVVAAGSSAAAYSLDRAYTAESSARKDADIKKIEAVKVRDLEKKAREKADRVSLLALDQNKKALDTQRIISVLTLKRLHDIPGTSDLSDELLTTSMKGLRENMAVMEQLKPILQDKAAEAVALRSLIGIYQRAGRLLEDIGKVQEADRYYRDMDTLAISLDANHPGDLDSRKVLSMSKATLGQFELNKLGDAKAALTHLTENLTLRREILGRDKTNDAYKQGVANALGYLAMAYLKLGDPAKAQDAFHEEFSIRTGVVSDVAESVEFRRELAGYLLKRGDASVARREDVSARNYYDESLKRREQLFTEYPDNLPIRHDLALSDNAIGTFELLQNNDPKKALEWYQKALTSFRQLLDGDPKRVTFKENVARTEYFVATALLRLGDKKQATDHYKECLTIRQGLADDPLAKVDRMDLMIIKARLGQVKAASEMAEDSIKTPRATHVFTSRPPAASPCARVPELPTPPTRSTTRPELSDVSTRP